MANRQFTLADTSAAQVFPGEGYGGAIQLQQAEDQDLVELLKDLDAAKKSLDALKAQGDGDKEVARSLQNLIETITRKIRDLLRKKHPGGG